MRWGRRADTAAAPAGNRRLSADGPAPACGAAPSPPPPPPILSGILLPPELECLRPVFAGATLALARERAADLGVGADRVLIGAGVIDEEAYLRRLAHRLGVTFETFTDAGAATCPLPPGRLAEAAASGLLPLRHGAGLVWVVAPRGLAARRLAELMMAAPQLASRIRLTTTRRLDDYIQTLGRAALAHLAADGLRERRPDLSAAPRPRARRGRTPALAILPLSTMAWLFPVTLFETLAAVLALWFLAFISLRLVASVAARPPPAALPRLSDDELPVYTVIAALYHEAGSVPALVAAIRRLDYPAEKLDIKLAVEPDDLATRAAIARLGPIPNLEVVVAPARGPRTKPKALNAALAFARGSFTVIYDAEDRPEPGQLRAALDAFRSHGGKVACAQASLCIDNLSDSWLSRMFGAEYAGQFDVFLPGFATLGLPLPLGGSSNHFRTAVLREVMGWDAYNVTEDADLGVRLARFGYRSVTFASTTYEEAPARLGGWLRQRTRWMKGWMQTWAVHMRAPRQLWRDLGARGFLALNAAIGGNVLTALIHPFFVAGTIVELATHRSGHDGLLWHGALAGLHETAIASGYLAAAAIGGVGLARRGQLRSLWVLALIPLYWLLLSAAAWRALHQMMTAPYRWEKTTHNLARSSHFVGGRTGAPRDSAAARRQPPRAVA